MSAPDIRVVLSADGVEQVLSAMRKVQTEVRKTGQGARESATGWGSLKQIASEFTGGILPQLGAAAAGAALVGLGKKALETADGIGKLSQKTGVSAETLSVFAFAARTADVESQTLSKSFQIFTRTMNQVDQGGREASDAVKELFGSASALNGLTMDERLKKIVDALGQMEPGSQKTALAMKFFGRSGADLIPLLDDMAGKFDEVRDRAEAFGMLVDSDLAAAAQNANDRMTDMATAAEGAAVQFMTGLMPALGDIAEGLVNATSQAGGLGEGLQWIGKGIGFILRVGVTAFVVVGNYIGTAARMGWDLVASIWEAGKAIVNLENPWKAFKSRALEGAEIAKMNVQAAVDQIKGIWGATDQAAPDAPKRSADWPAPGEGGGDGGGTYRPAKAERAFDLTEFDRQSAAAAAALDKEILSQQQAALDDAYKTGKITLEDYYDTKVMLARQAADIELNLSNLEIQSLQDKMAAATTAYERDQLQLEINEQMSAQELRRLELSGQIASVERERAAAIAARADEEAASGAKAMKSLEDSQNALRDSLQSGAVNVLNTFLTDTIFNANSAGAAFKAFGVSVISTLQQILTQVLVMQAVKSLFAAFGGGAASGVVGAVMPAAATGGIVAGGVPGVDSVPVMTMPGEGILTTAAMQRIGSEDFYALNSGRAYVVRSRSMPRFADGGIVGGEGAAAIQSASVDGAVTVGLEDGLVERRVEQFLDSSRGSRVLVKTAGRVPKGFRQALGGK